MLDDILAERIMAGIAGDIGRLGRFKAHVVPAEVLKTTGTLTESLRPHGRASGALARKKTRRKRGERLGFACHLHAPLLTDDAAAKAPDRTRTGRSDARRRTRRS